MDFRSNLEAQRHGIDERQGAIVQSIEVPEPQELTKCVSMVESSTSGSPSGAASLSAPDDDAVIAAPEATSEERANLVAPAEIPLEDSKGTNELETEGDDYSDEDESEYEYEDDDDVAFSGFLAPATTSVGTSTDNVAPEPARIVEEEVVAAPEESEASKRKWKEPSRAAVSMSLRAQSETSGGKRRLAQDLYRIMNQDTEDSGFSLAPKSEDSMDNWTIKLFQFDSDSNLAKDMAVLGINSVELEMKFPDQYPFEPPFARVVRPRFKRQTGFVMNGALCMELLTKDGWNPINDIESVIVSIRSLLVVGDGRLQTAADMPDSKYEALLKAATLKEDGESSRKKPRLSTDSETKIKPVSKERAGSYSASEAQAAYSHLSDYHKKKGWDTSGWWSRKG